MSYSITANAKCHRCSALGPRVQLSVQADGQPLNLGEADDKAAREGWVHTEHGLECPLHRLEGSLNAALPGKWRVLDHYGGFTMSPDLAPGWDSSVEICEPGDEGWGYTISFEFEHVEARNQAAALEAVLASIESIRSNRKTPAPLDPDPGGSAPQS